MGFLCLTIASAVANFDDFVKITTREAVGPQLAPYAKRKFVESDQKMQKKNDLNMQFKLKKMKINLNTAVLKWISKQKSMKPMDGKRS
jgi:hypothetical protein